MPKGMLASENGVLEGIRSHDFGAIVISLRIVSFEVGRYLRRSRRADFETG